jgi:hypothetical protein
MPSAAKSKTVTLVANTAQTVTITGTYRRVRIVNFDASSRVSAVCQGGAAATVDGDNTTPVPPASSVTVYDDTTPNAIAVTADAPTAYNVSLISSGTPTVCVYSE